MAYVEFSHELKSNRMASMHVHPCHELYYLAKGKTKYIIGEEIYPVEAGNLVFVPRGYYHITDYGDCELIERSLIYFDDGLFDKDTEPILDELMSMRLISIPINRVEGLEALLDSLERAMSIDGAFGDAVRKVHTLAVLSFVCRHRREFVPVLSEADIIVHRVSEYVSAHYGEGYFATMRKSRAAHGFYDTDTCDLAAFNTLCDKYHVAHRARKARDEGCLLALRYIECIRAVGQVIGLTADTTHMRDHSTRVSLGAFSEYKATHKIYI